MASPSYTYTLTNGSTADASQVMQNYNDILNGVTDGTKDLSISALTCAGTATLNGSVNLGNASADDLTITASLASTLPIKTNNAFDIGSSTLGLRALYLGGGGAGLTCSIIAASHATTRAYTVPDVGAAASFVMTGLAQTISGAKTFTVGQIIDGTADEIQCTVQGHSTQTSDIFLAEKSDGTDLLKVTNTAGTAIRGTTLITAAATSFVGQTVTSTISSAQNAAATNTLLALTSITIDAGDWNVSASVTLLTNSSTITGVCQVVVGRTTASTANTVSGLDEVGIAPAVATAGQNTVCVSTLSVQSNGTNCTVNGANSVASQVLYLNVLATYSAGTPTWRGTITARRVR